ncbi:MAG: S9 family peptidase [Flavobacteriales bacterium]
MPNEHPAPPVAERIDHPITAHSHVRNDPWAWLRLSEEQREADPPDAHTKRVIAHLEAENTYAEHWLAPVKELRERLFLEMKARVKEEDLSVPYRENGFWYNQRYDKGKEYAVQLRAPVRPDGSVPEAYDVLLDENVLAEGCEFFDLGDFDVSPNNRLCAYSVDTVGRRQYTIRFRDITTGGDLPDVITNTSGGGAWADDRTYFYSRKDSTLRSYKILRHVLGTPESADVEVFHEADPAFACDVFRDRSNTYVVITTGSTLSSEEWLLPVDEPNGTFRVFLPREREHEYSAQHMDGVFYILTNWQARNFRLMKSHAIGVPKERWEEVIPHREDVLLEDVELFKRHRVVSERREGLTHLRITDTEQGAEHEIRFHDPAYVVYSGTNPEADTESLRYGYTSLTTPSSIYEHDMRLRTDRLLKQQEVVGGFDPAAYTSERVWAVARDGQRVPMSIVYRKGTPIDGSAPLLLYGYGSYGISMEPVFSSARLSLLDRGFIYAMAHIRGGEELGRRWYEEGKMEHKTNTFTDFIDCAEHLLRQGYADPKRLFCMGGSAGGLLVGAVANMRPDLWNGIVAEVPFVDVVTTMLDESIPLTTGEFDEWGDPKQKEAYERMLSYSPYDNVHDAKYPAMLVLTGFHDSQVQYWEPAKWVQRLREHQQGDAPILLKTNLDAGHGGASGRFERLKEVAQIYAFLLMRAGMVAGA